MELRTEQPGPSAARAPVRPVFMLSLPRSGSTLLQRLLAGHPQVHTVAEPWLMLHLAAAAGHHNGLSMDYDPGVAERAMEDFAAGLPGGLPELVRRLDEDLARWRKPGVAWPKLAKAGPVGAVLARVAAGAGEAQALRAACAGSARALYAAHAAAAGSSATVFLDKTPRYYLIADFLAAAFPEAEFIVLWRNPVDTLASFYTTWWDGRGDPRVHAVDLVHGPALLARAAAALGPRALVVDYNRLLAAPGPELRRITGFLGLDPGVDLPARLPQVRIPGRMGDPGREANPRLRPPRPDAWRRALDTPARRRAAAGWLALLPDEACRAFGVDRAATARMLGEELPAAPAWPDWFEAATAARRPRPHKLRRLWARIRRRWR